MSKSWMAICIALISFVLLAQTKPAPTSQPHTGRYQIFFSPLARADAYLVDTDTGRIWREVQFSNVPHQPFVWLPVDKVDNKQQQDEWELSHSSTAPAP